MILKKKIKKKITKILNAISKSKNIQASSYYPEYELGLVCVVKPSRSGISCHNFKKNYLNEYIHLQLYLILFTLNIFYNNLQKLITKILFA